MKKNKKNFKTKKNSIELQELGEVKFGPKIYRLKIDALEVNNRFFLENLACSENANYFAIEELHHEKKEDSVSMSIFDAENLKFYPISVPKGGRVKPTFIDEKIVRYQKILSTGVVKEFELSLSEIKSWIKMSS